LFRNRPFSVFANSPSIDVLIFLDHLDLSHNGMHAEGAMRLRTAWRGTVAALRLQEEVCTEEGDTKQEQQEEVEGRSEDEDDQEEDFAGIISKRIGQLPVYQGIVFVV